MPPKFKFTREEIINKALDIVRAEGIDALTARALAEKLGTSSKPIFGLFSGMEELLDAVKLAAYELYGSYISKALARTDIPPYKASGLAYIQFARDEKELFKLLFMCDRRGENIYEDRESVLPQLRIIMERLGVDEDTAYLFHLEMWIYVHGIATMTATSYLEWDEHFISDTLTDMFLGLSHRTKEKLNDSNKNN